MTNLIPSPQVTLVNGRPATTSLAIAEHFGKRHDSVLRDVRRVISDCPAEFSLHNFVETPYTDKQNGQTYPMFNVFQDGFVLLVMGYAGAKAMKMKLTYIMAFNAMRDELAKSGKKTRKKALPAPEPEADASDRHRRIREYLEIVTKIVDRLEWDARLWIPKGGRFSQMTLLDRINQSAARTAKSLHEALAHLREANSLTRLLSPVGKDDKVAIVPLVGKIG